MLTKHSLYLVGVAVCLPLAGCGGSDSGSPRTTIDAAVSAVIAGVASDYTSSDISIVDSKAPFDVVKGYNEVDQSDYGLDGYGSHYYRIGRYDIDTLTKYAISAPTQPVWQFSTNSLAETTTKNPYDVVFAGESKAYLIRYESPIAWIINPSVSQGEPSAFKLGEIDLSAYNDADGAPEASAGVIVGSKLFIIMQRLDKTAGWVPGDAYLAVFDTASGAEIDTNTSDDPANLKGIRLAIKNPTTLVAIGDVVYVSGVGSYYPQEFTGGIQSISATSYAVATVLDDGDDMSHPYGQISGMEIVSSTLGYFKGYSGWQSETLYQFNPSTGSVEPTPVLGIEGKFISCLAVSPDQKLWVGIGDSVSPHVLIVDTTNNTEAGRVDLLRNPSDITFITGE